MTGREPLRPRREVGDAVDERRGIADVRGPEAVEAADDVRP